MSRAHDLTRQEVKDRLLISEADIIKFYPVIDEWASLTPEEQELTDKKRFDEQPKDI